MNSAPFALVELRHANVDQFSLFFEKKLFSANWLVKGSDDDSFHFAVDEAEEFDDQAIFF
jgi:hypothetical protein